MRSARVRFRRQFDTSIASKKLPPKSLPTLFLDYDQGAKIIPSILEKAGISFVRLQDRFQRNAPDTEWIPYCAAEGLVIVTGDRGIELDPVNIHSVVKHKAKVVMLDENCSKAATWASALIVSQGSIAEETSGDGPLIVSLRNNGILTHGWRRPKVQADMFENRAKCSEVE